MSAEARDALVRAIERRGALPGSAWLQALRAEAAAGFAAQGLPTRRDEAWRFTDLSDLAALPLDGSGPAAREGKGHVDVIGEACHLLVFVDGVFAPGVSSPGTLPAGVELRPLSGALESASAADLAPLFTVSDAKRRSLSALNSALFEDGVLLRVAAGVQVERPIHLVFLHAGAPLVTPRCGIALGAGSRAQLVEHYLGSDAPGLVTPVTEIDLAPDAELLHVHLQAQGAGVFHLAELAVRQGERSRLRSISLALGARLARVDLASALAGAGAHAELLGLYAGRGSQHLDHHTTIDHATPQTTSRELYKGILDERAKGIFLGRIHVRPHAQKIDAMQTNRTLLLSDAAAIHTRPQLEIHADDVRCSHGASIGRLDESHLFYLRARGIDEVDARALLISGFAGEVLAELPWPRLRAHVSERLGLPAGIA
jgi:Fe-S cluster assembly protein SufD